MALRPEVHIKQNSLRIPFTRLPNSHKKYQKKFDNSEITVNERNRKRAKRQNNNFYLFKSKKSKIINSRWLYLRNTFSRSVLYLAGKRWNSEKRLIKRLEIDNVYDVKKVLIRLDSIR